MTLEGPRVMNKVVNGSYGEMAAPNGIYTVGPTQEGWGTGTTDNAREFAVHRSYFDLSGYQLEDLTVYFQGVEPQESTCPRGTAHNLETYLFLTTEYVSEDEITLWLDNGAGTFSGLGFSDSKFNQEQIIFARQRVYRNDGSVTPAMPNIQAVSQWGTCAASTADKIHITRIVFMRTNAAGAYYHVPDVNMVVGIIVGREPELPFLMRQKRSYEIATGP